MRNKDLHFPIHPEASFDKVALHSLAGIKEQELSSPHERDRR
jgi:hypothetical protein